MNSINKLNKLKRTIARPSLLFCLITDNHFYLNCCLNGFEITRFVLPYSPVVIHLSRNVSTQIVLFKGIGVLANLVLVSCPGEHDEILM